MMMREQACRLAMRAERPQLKEIVCPSVLSCSATATAPTSKKTIIRNPDSAVSVPFAISEAGLPLLSPNLD
jgi:hypothetical protein